MIAFLSRKELRRRVAELTAQLREAGATLSATRAGDVDANVVSGEGSQQDVSVTGDDSVYRPIVESMQEAALITTLDGRVLFCNRQFGVMLKVAPEATVGRNLVEFVSGEDLPTINSVFEIIQTRLFKGTIHFHSASAIVPVFISAGLLPQKDSTSIFIVAADLSELEEFQARYRSLFENMLNAFARCKMIFDGSRPLDFTYLEVNSAFEALTGLKDVEGRRISEIIPGVHESNPELLEVCGRVSLTGVPEKFETYLSQLNRWFSISVICPQAEHFVAIFENISDRKLLAQRVEHERMLLSTLVNSLPDLVSAKDREGRFMLANLALAKVAGVSDQDDLIGKTSYCPALSSLSKKFEVGDRYVLDTGKSIINEEWSLVTPEGLYRWYLTTKVPLVDKGGTIIGVIGISREITERKQAEERLAAQAALLDSSTDAILVRDMRKRITYWNKSATIIYGWSGEEALGRDANELLYAPEHVEDPVRASVTVMEKGEWTGELHQKRKDGRPFIVEARWSLVHDSRGDPVGILCVETDVTERRSVQAQLFRAQRLESLGTLAGGIAHDLNNVLSPILMGVEGLGLQSHDQMSKKMLEIIKASALRGANIVRQVLSFARGAEGERSEVQLKHIIREVVQIMEETFPKSIEIRSEIPKDLPTITANATEIHQVLMNLCVNARDAMPDGGMLTLSVEQVRLDETYARMNVEAKPMDYVVLNVADTGTGMAPSLVEKIFDPFFTTKKPGKGTGLGLSVTRTIVKNHGGFINVQSGLGNGSVFKVYLPASQLSKEVEIVTSGVPMGKGELILVVDDEEALREIAKQILESYGYRVVTANDGAEAVASYVARKGQIRAVVTDVVMPYMDGAALVRALQKIDPAVKIVATSGLMADGQSKALTDSGVEAFLDKPYTAEKLLETLMQVLDTAPASA